MQEPLVLMKLNSRSDGNLPVHEHENVALQDLIQYCSQYCSLKNKIRSG